jgi:protein-S-isoprenylcysteine O-methyltransferase Ste14
MSSTENRESYRGPIAAPSARPASATHFFLYFPALACVLATIAFLRHAGWTRPQEVALALAAVTIPIVLVDLLVLRVHRRASTGLDWSRRTDPSIARTATKLLGLALTISVIAIAFWAFPEYRPAKDGTTFYAPTYQALAHLRDPRIGVPFAIVIALYVFFIDARMTEPRDAYWQLGRLVLGHADDVRTSDVGNHARGWLVKAFFLPLMVTFLFRQLGGVLGMQIEAPTLTNLRAYDFGYELMFVLDLVFTVAGYVMSLRILDTHIRSAEPTMVGWIVAVAMYQPFNSMVSGQYLAYEVGPRFGAWLAEYPTIRWCWAGAILLLLAIYALATVTFGLRFSNLTHRGILTGGPYRFTKHPAYVSKNLSWWLLSTPFVAYGGRLEAVRGSLLLLGVNTFYFMRARTEERHLSRDPAYVAYALWMNDHSIFRGVARWLPFLKYEPPPLTTSMHSESPRA